VQILKTIFTPQVHRQTQTANLYKQNTQSAFQRICQSKQTIPSWFRSDLQ